MFGASKPARGAMCAVALGGLLALAAVAPGTNRSPRPAAVEPSVQEAGRSVRGCAAGLGRIVLGAWLRDQWTILQGLVQAQQACF